MLPYLGTQFANPSATYHAAHARRGAPIDDAREQVAHFVGCEPDEVVFTSGGTEADNLAVAGGHAARTWSDRHLLGRARGGAPYRTRTRGGRGRR